MKIILDGEKGESWASYQPKRRFWQSPTIILHGSDEKVAPDTEYAKTIFGLDHEYLHHILYELQGLDACRGLDRIIGPPPDLVQHCIWTGFRGFHIIHNGIEVYNTVSTEQSQEKK